jgi:capsid portal protein
MNENTNHTDPSPIGKTDVFTRSTDVVYRKIAEETLLVPIRRRIDDKEDSIFQLKGVGSRIWELIDGEKTVEAIAEQMQKEFDAAQEVIDRDLRQFLHRLLALGMISRSQAARGE